ncbi:hypothetical protein ACOMHN_047432 [Nucella lapillus]
MFGHQCVVVIVTFVQNNSQNVSWVTTAPINKRNGNGNIVTFLARSEFYSTSFDHSFCLLHLEFPTLLSMKVYLDLSSVKKCHVFNRVNVINFVDVRRSEIGGLANK